MLLSLRDIYYINILLFAGIYFKGPQSLIYIIIIIIIIIIIQFANINLRRIGLSENRRLAIISQRSKISTSPLK